MKMLAMFLAAAALAACSGTEDGDAPSADETRIAAGESAGGTMPGTYQVTLPDGTIGTSMLMEDGTYLDTFGERSESGTWADAAGKTCFDPDGEETPARCYSIGEPAADGSFTVTPDKGDPVKIRKLD